MTPTLEAPAVDTATGGDWTSELSADLQAGFSADETPQEETPEAVPEAEAAPVDEAAPETPVAVTPADPNAPPYKLTTDGNGYIVPKAELPQLQGFKTYAETLQQTFPTVQDAMNAHQQAIDLRNMQVDYITGGEPHIKAILDYWSTGGTNDPTTRAQYAESFVKMASKVPDVLKQINPQAHDQMGSSFVAARIEAAYAKAAQTGDKNDLLQAQSLDWGITGRYKTELPKHDPVKAQEAAIRARAEQVSQREAAMLNRDWNTFNNGTVEGPKWNQFNAAIDKALEPVKNRYAPDDFAIVREKLAQGVLSEINKDYAFSQTHNNELNYLQNEHARLWKAGQPTAALTNKIQAYQNNLLARVRQVLPGIAGPVLKTATARAVAQQPPKPGSTPPKPATPAPPASRAATPHNWEDDLRQTLRSARP